MSLSIAIITKNEEQNLEDCLKSVSWADEIVLIDSGSTDRTVEIAKRFNAKTYDIPFVNFSAQKNAALERCTGDWIFLIDADERMTPELAREIKSLSELEPEAVYAVKRTTLFFGKPLRFSGTQKDWPIRLFPKNKARFTQPVHETVETTLPVRHLHSTLAHLTTKNLAQYRQKIDKYVPLEVEVLRKRNRRSLFSDTILRPPAQFANLYFIQAGVLDGITGLQYAGLSAYYTFLKYRSYYFSPKAKKR